MTIPSQLPQIVTAARTGALQALALQSGQVVEGRIVGAAPNGGTQVEIRGQMLNLLLPMATKAGETLKFEVQGNGQQMRLALQLASAAPTATPAAPQASAPLPQASVQPTVAQPQPNPVPQAAMAASPTVAPAQPATVAPPPLPTAPLPQTPGGVSSPVAPPLASSPAPQQVALPNTPYPQSIAPTPAAPLATAAVGPAAAPPAAPGAAPAVIAPVAPVTPAMPVASATGNPVPTAVAPALPSTPQAALAQMVHAAVPRQDSVTSLTAALTSIAGKVVLPEPVARAAQQVLAGRVAIDAPKFDGAALQAAVKGSGTFQEAALARGQLPLPQADMKSALLALRQTLVNWLGPQAPIAAVAHVPPPIKGGVIRARGGDAPPVEPTAPAEEVGKQLLERTESALSRVRLHQHASLPDAQARTADWSMDLPVMIGTHQTLMQLQIHRDQHNESDTTAERGWQMRFAISLPGLGEVGAQVSLRAGTTGVMLWASEPEASAALESEVAALRHTLAEAGLNPGAVIVRHGAPAMPAPAPSGHFVDART